MKKDSFYFPHFSNARHDRKIKRLMKQLGVEGYGIFFMLLEVLREQTDLKYPLDDVDLLADEFGTSEAKIKTVISGYDLFQFDEYGKFFSVKQIFYLQPYFERSEKQREKALKRWGKAESDAAALPQYSHGNATKLNETKLNETKEKERPKKIIGDTEKNYILIYPQDIHSTIYKVHGIDGINEIFEMNMSRVSNPEMIDKYLRDRNGKHLNDFRHLFSDFQLFVKNYYK